jgi:asparagine synthase (glutamine-hydrolysing)
MCGIAGIATPAGKPAEAGSHAGGFAALGRSMCEALAHRGPDDCGLWHDSGVVLGHRRLSIVDISPLGHNPMAWDNGRLWITYNGEIYNFRELRRELESLGHRFRSQTDTEVILAAYDQWGVECLQRFAGMFAFALWDAPRRRLWLARDRVGKKPLYYSVRDNGVLQFASELKAFVVDPTFPRDVDSAAVRMYLRYGYVPSPHTIYRAARKLPPGHQLLYENGRAAVTRYWDAVPFALTTIDRSDADAIAATERALSLAVQQRMIADVPLGAFLSGGIDSSLIVALMQEQSATPVQTFTIRFTNPQFNEADHAAAVARHLGTDHYERTCDGREMLEVVDRLADMFDEPFADSSAVPTYLVSKIAREFVTVALSGDGGDELFLGYPRYRYHEAAAAALALPRPVRHAAAAVADRLPTRRLRRIGDVLRSDESDQYARFISWWTPQEIFRLTGTPPEVAPLYADAFARTGAMARGDRPGLLDLVSYLPEDILTKVDRASMAVSLEARCPLLDHRVVELALSLPPSMKRRGRAGKWLLRQLLHKRVPRALIDRPKMGFGVPLGDWFRGPLRIRMEDYCAGPELEDLGIDAAPVRALWRDVLAGRSHRTDLVWQMFSLIAWARRFRAAPAPVEA